MVGFFEGNSGSYRLGDAGVELYYEFLVLAWVYVDEILPDLEVPGRTVQIYRIGDSLSSGIFESDSLIQGIVKKAAEFYRRSGLVARESKV